jgi:ElaB/YqjD/DUF883 family membrane-anchored ribosome-binding protein
MNSTQLAQDLARSTNASIDRAADRASDALDTAHKAADHAIDKMAVNSKSVVSKTPGIVDMAVERLKLVGEKSSVLAKEASVAAKEKAQLVADQTSDRIRKDPLKSMLVAVAAGAALATVAGAMARRKR